MERAEYASDRIKQSPYHFDPPLAGQPLFPHYLNAHRLSMIFSLPDVCESKRSVVWWLIA